MPKVSADVAARTLWRPDPGHHLNAAEGSALPFDGRVPAGSTAWDRDFLTQFSGWQATEDEDSLRTSDQAALMLCGDGPLTPAATPDIQPFLAVDAEQVLVIHRVALAAQEDMQPPAAEPAAHARQPPPVVRAARGRPAGPRHTAWSSDNSPSPGTPPVRSSRGPPPDARPVAASQRRHCFFPWRSFSTALSSIASASRRFGRAFSSTTPFRRLAWQ